MKSHNLQNFLFISGILVVGFVSAFLFKAPKPQPISILESEFSAHRAFEHVKKISQKPHSIGTEEHECVKNYIVSELQELGLKTSVQTTTSISYEKVLKAGYIHNILGVIKGSESKKTILFVGHYDSHSYSYGAADDGSAIATMLEAARAIKKLNTLRNDIAFLFTDGEETGLFGIKAFIDENSLLDSIGLVLNIEARGSSGPVLTYEVSSQNGWIMREYIKAVPYPFAQSIAYEVYKLMPNSTDFTPLKNAGLSGFNNAFIEDFANYHSMTDASQNLSIESLQHHGSYCLGIARHFGNLDLSDSKSEDVIYFNWIGHSIILYPISLNLFFVIAVTLLLISLVIIGIRKNRLSIFKILVSTLVFVVSLVVVMIFTWLLLTTVKSIYPYYTNFDASNFYNIKNYFFAFSCLAIAVFSSVYVLFFRKVNSENLLVGSLLVSYILMIVFILKIPTGAYLVIVPLILILSGLLICYVFNFSLENKKWAFLLIHFISLVPVVSMFAPLLRMFFVSFGLNTIYIGIAVLIILMGYLVVLLKLFYDRKKWSLPLIALLFVIGELIVAHLTSGFTKQHPLRSNVSYFLNSDQNKALWFSPHKYIDEWKSQFFKNCEFKPMDELHFNQTRKFIQNEAKVYTQSLPELVIKNDTTENGVRSLSLIINTTSFAESCQFLIKNNAQLISFKVNGKDIFDTGFYSDTIGGYYSLYYFGLSEKPLELTFKTKLGNNLEVELVESKLGLPEFEGYIQMPDFIIPDRDYYSKSIFSNVTLVKKTWRL